MKARKIIYRMAGTSGGVVKCSAGSRLHINTRGAVIRNASRSENCKIYTPTDVCLGRFQEFDPPHQNGKSPKASEHKEPEIA